ncbi:hypothetical protein, partial [Nonomuraea lactucae]|uniref:hypothetical protein n=1 Tax=Nonomuraea lactucae TaxID=2249762 RepID=UPI0019668640
ARTLATFRSPSGGTAPRKPGPRRPGPRPTPASRKQPRGRPRQDRHHDWAWEVVGFLLCVAIAMIVFFAMPTIISP